jgi:hypothetical protein
MRVVHRYLVDSRDCLQSQQRSSEDETPPIRHIMEIRISKVLVTVLRLGLLSLECLFERDRILRQYPGRETLFNLPLIVRPNPILRLQQPLQFETVVAAKIRFVKANPRQADPNVQQAMYQCKNAQIRFARDQESHLLDWNAVRRVHDGFSRVETKRVERDDESLVDALDVLCLSETADSKPLREERQTGFAPVALESWQECDVFEVLVSFDEMLCVVSHKNRYRRVDLAQRMFIDVVSPAQAAGSHIDVAGGRFGLRVHVTETACLAFDVVDKGLDFCYGLESRGDCVSLFVKDPEELDLWCGEPRVYEEVKVWPRVDIVPWDLNEP